MKPDKLNFPEWAWTRLIYRGEIVMYVVKKMDDIRRQMETINLIKKREPLKKSFCVPTYLI